MTNKEFRDVLAKYPDNYIIAIDKSNPWDKTPKLVTPHLYINTDIGQIEIEYDTYDDIDDRVHIPLEDAIDALKNLANHTIQP